MVISMLSYYEMEVKFGAAIAYQCLTEIEKAAHIPSWEMAEIDPETRLATAIHVQDCASDTSLVA
jgi:hypothetical protein